MLDNRSYKELFQSLPVHEQIARVSALTDDQAAALLYDWDWNARQNQKTPPGDWNFWLILAGRGFGKTRTGAQWVLERKKQGYKYINLIGATFNDAVDIMIKGESGILNVSPPAERPIFKNDELHWPDGSISLIFSADSVERFRGKQSDSLWADEFCSWRYPEAWDQAIFGLRLGDDPRAVITTTPKPTKALKTIVENKNTFITRGSTFDNRSNLPKVFINELIGKYEGTRLGRQEIYAEVLEDIEGALWVQKDIDETRLESYNLNDLIRIVVAIDPSVTSGEDSDETGIIVAGVSADEHYYILDDLSLLGNFKEWSKTAVAAYHKYAADRIVAEVNNGGDMIEGVIRSVDESVSYKKVHASRGKIVRAEPVAALYEKKKVHHVGSASKFEKLEKQMTNFVAIAGQKSPDRMDALVWALTDLMDSGGSMGVFNYYALLEKERLEKERQ